MKRSTATILILVSLAAIAASVATIVNINGRKDIAAAELRKAAHESETAARAAKKAKAEAEAEASRAQSAEAEKAAQAAKKENLAEERRVQELEKANLAEKKCVAEAEAKAAADSAKAAADSRAAAETGLKTAREEKAKAELALKTAEVEAEKAASLKAKAEADALRTKHSLAELDQMKESYARLIDETQSLRSELEEMKRALTPEKTVADLMTTGEDEAGTATNTTAVAEDRNMPRGKRALDKEERAGAKRAAATAEQRRKEIISALTALMERAIAEDRAIDARFYHSAIKSLYPDWTYVKE